MFLRLPRLGTARRGWILIDLWQDLRFALRSLKKQPGFALLAILALSLGIGSTTVGFGVAENVLDPYPYEGANRMVTFAFHDLKTPRNGTRVGRLSIQPFLDYQKSNHVLDDMVGCYPGWIVYSGEGSSEDFRGAYVTANTFNWSDPLK